MTPAWRIAPGTENRQISRKIQQAMGPRDTYGTRRRIMNSKKIMNLAVGTPSNGCVPFQSTNCGSCCNSSAGAQGSNNQNNPASSPVYPAGPGDGDDDPLRPNSNGLAQAFWYKHRAEILLLIFLFILIAILIIVIAILIALWQLQCGPRFFP